MYLLASIELTLPALLQHREMPVTYSGPILTGFALASIIGGLIYGARTWPGSVHRQSTLLLVIMIAGVAATAFASSWTVIAALLALTGLLQAAVLITRNLTLREQLPADLHPVGYSVLYAGSGIGYGISAAATGLLLTVTTPDTSVLIATGTTLLLTAATWLRRGRPRRTGGGRTSLSLRKGESTFPGTSGLALRISVLTSACPVAPADGSGSSLAGSSASLLAGSTGWRLRLAGQEADYGAGGHQLLANLTVLQGQLVDDPDQCFTVCAELGEFVFVVRAEFLQLDDLPAQPHFDVGRLAPLFDLRVELVLQIEVALSESIAGTSASAARDLMVRAPSERSGVPARMRSMAAWMRSRSSGAGLMRCPGG